MTEEYTKEQLYALDRFLGTLDVHTTYNINNRVPVLSSDVELKKLSSNLYEAEWTVWRLALDGSKLKGLNIPCDLYEEIYFIQITSEILDNIENIVKEDESTQLDYEIDYTKEIILNECELGDPRIPDYIIEECIYHYEVDSWEIGNQLQEWYDEDGSGMTKTQEFFDHPKVIHDFLSECLEEL